MKVSAGPPSDETEDLQLDVWAGVLPVTVAWGEPEPCPQLVGDTSPPPHVVERR